MRGFIKEACVEGLEQAILAEQNGADRIELCARLDLDGITPDYETIQAVVHRLSIPVRVMVRPREGNFHYSEGEINQMLETIAYCLSVGVEGVVFGVLDENDLVDIARVQKLITAAKPLKTVFHRAIEATPDIMRSVTSLRNDTTIDAILVSGTGGGKAEDQLFELQELIDLFVPRELVVCGKVTQENLPMIHQQLGAKAYHGKLIVGELN